MSKLIRKIHFKRGQNPAPSLGVIDSQSVRWGNNRTLNGFDGNKKVKGIKHHIGFDKNGFLLAVIVTVTNVHDSKTSLIIDENLKISPKFCESNSCRWRLYM